MAHLGTWQREPCHCKIDSNTCTLKCDVQQKEYLYDMTSYKYMFRNNIKHNLQLQNIIITGNIILFTKKNIMNGSQF